MHQNTRRLADFYAALEIGTMLLFGYGSREFRTEVLIATAAQP